MNIDRRIIKKKNIIRRAFLELALEKPINDITISELSQKAEINRSTFYLHYKDISEVAEDIDRLLSDKVLACLKDMDINNIYSSSYQIFSNISEELDESETLKKYILFARDSSKIYDKLKKILFDKAIESLRGKFPDIALKEIEYPLTFICAGTVDSYVKWAHSEKPDKIHIEELFSEISAIIDGIIARIK